MKKFNIVCVMHDFKTSILGTYLTKKDAMEAMETIVDQEYRNTDSQRYFKVYHESKEEKTIFSCGYIYGKSMYAKYFILEFDDKDLL